MKPVPQEKRVQAADNNMRKFSYNAQKLSGQIALLLGWRPAEFWDATPHEITTILSANDAHNIPAVDRKALEHLIRKDQKNSGQ